MQIALVAVVLLAGAWFTVLRPKPAEDTATDASVPARSAPKAPGQKGLENAVAKAKDAVAKSGAGAAAGAPATASKPAATKAAAAKGTTASSSSAAAAPAKDPSAPLLAKLDQGRTVVVLFTHEGGSIDRTVRKAVRRLAAADKKVATAVVPISKVGRYEAITTGVSVLSAPTVVVIGKGQRAKTVSGFTEVKTLKQMVGDVRRAAAAAAAKK